MREILFRGKTYEDKWVQGTYYHQKEFYGDETDFHYIIESCDQLEDNMMIVSGVIPETIGQYTGLTDKNGTKIFEGDIVRQDYSKTINVMYDPDTLGLIDSECIEGHHIGIVKISPHKGVGMRNPMSYNDIDCTKRKVKYYVNVCCYRCEVIGNIHDNPELLESEVDTEC